MGKQFQGACKTGKCDAGGLGGACLCSLDRPVYIPRVSNRLSCWFSLSYASWLTLPRVLMEAMPVEWQDKMAALLEEYDAAFPNQPDIGSRVQVTDGGGKLIKTPAWLINYRHPNFDKIAELRRPWSLEE